MKIRNHLAFYSIFAVFLLIFSSSVAFSAYWGESNGEIAITLTFHAPRIKLYGENATVYMRNATITSSPGDPMLPFYSYFIALPPDADLKDVKLHYKVEIGGETLIGEAKVVPSPPYVTFLKGKLIEYWGRKEVRKGYDERVYSSDNYYPNCTIRIVSRGDLRGIKLVGIQVFPVKYNPKEGRIIYYKKIEVKMNYVLGGLKGFFDYSSMEILEAMREQILNWKKAIGWYSSVYTPSTSAYLIVTTENEYLNLRKPLLDLARSRSLWGLRVYLLTEKELYSYSLLKNSFDPLGVLGYDPQGKYFGQNRCIALRDWLKENYEKYHILYVLLIGDPDPQDVATNDHVYGDLPMVMTYAHPVEENGFSPYGELPTDYYYSALKGTWDENKDGKLLDTYSEISYTDFYPQVFVGRIPSYGNYTLVSQIIERIAKYDGLKSDRVLTALAILNYKNEDKNPVPRTDGRYFPHYLSKELGKEWKVLALYEEGGLKPVPKNASNFLGALNTQNFVNTWNEGVGLDILCAHGYLESAWRKVWVNDSNKDGIPEKYEMHWILLLSTYLAKYYLKAQNAVVYHGSCLNAFPSDPNNLIYGMLSRSISAIGSTRTEYYSPGSWIPSEKPAGDVLMIAYNLANYFLNKGYSLGESLFLARAGVLKESYGAPGYPVWLDNFLEISLYGDPALLAKPPVSASIWISSNSDVARYATSGNGTPENPYIISGISLNASGADVGIYVENVSVYVIFRNIRVVGNSFAGIAFENCKNIVVEESEISGFNFGILLRGCENFRVEYNFFKGDEISIFLKDSSNSTFIGDTFVGGKAFLKIDGDDGVFLENLTAFSCSLLFISGKNVVVKGVTVNGKEVIFEQNKGKVIIRGKEVGEILAINVTELKIDSISVARSYIGIELLGVSEINLTRSYFSMVEIPIYAMSLGGGNVTGNVFTSVNRSCLYFQGNISSSLYVYENYFSYFSELYFSRYPITLYFHSKEKIRYSYNGKERLNYLGNYYYGYKENDENGDGISETLVQVPVMIGNSTVLENVSYALTYSLASELMKDMDFPPRIEEVWPSSGYFKEKEIEAWAIVNDTDLKEVYIQGKVAKKGEDGKYISEITLSPGKYFITVTAVDKKGNWAIEKKEINVDWTPPEIRLIFPAKNGTWLREKNVEVMIEVFDPDLNESSLTLLENGKKIDFIFSNWVMAAKINLSEGKNVLEVFAKDLAGNYAEKKFYLYLDTIPPKIWILEPVDNAYLNETEVTLSWKASDNYKLKCVRIYVDYLCQKIIYGENATFGTIFLEISPGKHEIMLAAEDLAGNVAIATLNITVDTKPPSVKILYPSGLSWINRKNITVYWEEFDNYGIEETYIIVNGKVVKELEGKMGVQKATVEVPQGNVYLAIVAKDLAGNKGSAVVLIKVDYTPPEIEILSPSKQTYWVNSSASRKVLEISWIGKDNVKVEKYEVYLNGRKIYEGTENSTEISLVPGNYSLQVVGRDEANNFGESSKKFEIRVDSKPPNVAYFIIERKYTNEEYDIISWKTLDNESGIKFVEILDNGKVLGKFKATGELKVHLEKGKNEIEIIAYDNALNFKRIVKYAYLDLSPPKVIISLENGKYFNSTGEAKVKISMKDDFGLKVARVYLDGKLYKEIKLNGTEKEELLNFTSLSKGKHVIWIIAQDLAGNVGNASSEIFFDYTPPKVEVSCPVGYINRSQVEISWNSSDNLGIKKAEIIFNGKLISKKASGEEILSPKEGYNSIKVIVVDLAGNERCVEKSFYLDKTPPQVKITSPRNGSVIRMGIMAKSAQVKLSWNGSDNTGIAYYSVYLDGREIYKGSGENLTISLSPGSHKIKVVAVDLAGNFGSSEINLKVSQLSVYYLYASLIAILTIFVGYEIFRRKMLQRRITVPGRSNLGN